jgi:hypothetical protein
VAWTTIWLADCVDPDVAAIRPRPRLPRAGLPRREVKPAWPSPRDAWTSFCGGSRADAPYLDRRDEIDPGLLRIIESELRNPPTKYVQAWFDRSPAAAPARSSRSTICR